MHLAYYYKQALGQKYNTGTEILKTSRAEQPLSKKCSQKRGQK